jgi:hypothetical protein
VQQDAIDGERKVHDRSVVEKQNVYPEAAIEAGPE